MTLNTASTLHRRGASAARKAHNLEVTGSTPVAGILSLRLLIELTLNPPSFSWWCTEAIRHSSRDEKHEQKTTLYRSGAGEARGAHNPEAVGSNPTSGIISIRLFYRIRHTVIAKRR